MQNIKEVSLGFAEFVSQLIEETFDAILSSQNYQLEKYAELESRLEMSNEAYIANYISTDQIESRSLEYFGFEVKEKMKIPEEFEQFLLDNTDDGMKPVKEKELTKEGFDFVWQFVAGLIVEEQKSQLHLLINKFNSMNLIVDSGEILAKLELSNLYSEQKHAGPSPDDVARSKVSQVKKVQDQLEKGIEQLSLPASGKLVDVIKYEDPKSGKSTILIDKKALRGGQDTNISIPSVRLAVQPTKINNSSNLYSEIKINFKTV